MVSSLVGAVCRTVSRSIGCVASEREKLGSMQAKDGKPTMPDTSSKSGSCKSSADSIDELSQHPHGTFVIHNAVCYMYVVTQ